MPLAQVGGWGLDSKLDTLPETNIFAPESRPSQKETGIQTIHFQVLLLMEEILHQLIW